ncbi:MAG: hypothetical protein M3N29_10110, partial [Chloroflexota bacterium]|nr:hypothetical protein [Chloroflexota bacterium]
LPRPADALAIAEPAAEVDALRRAALAGLAGLSVAYAVFARDGRRRNVIGLLGLVAVALTVATAAVGWAPSAVDGVPLAVQLALLSVSAGGALAALTLGHWYLVTPRLSVQPLVLLTRVLAVVIAIQLAVFAVWAAFGSGPAQAAFQAVSGPHALYGWLRLLVTLAFPFVLVLMAHQTARSRSMESATGLLYIAVAAIFAGTIGAAALYVTSGLLV